MKKQLTREQAIEEIFEYEYDTIDWGNVAEMLRHGYRGIENADDTYLADAYHAYFGKHLIIVD